MKATIPIGVQPGTKLIRIDRIQGTKHVLDVKTVYTPGRWLVWIHHNVDFTLGTYIALYHDGGADRVTVNEDGTESITPIKPKDE